MDNNQKPENISNEDKRVVKSITRRMVESFHKIQSEQQSLLDEARKHRPQAEYYKGKINEAFERTTKKALEVCVEETSKIQGRTPEAEAQKDAIYQDYEQKVNRFTKLRDDLKKAAEK